MIISDLLLDPQVKDLYRKLLENYSHTESNKILTDSLVILGDRVITPSETPNKKCIKRINKYKYPDKLTKFVEKVIEKDQEWKRYSFRDLF